jgi:TonB-linked SusC/RagA family outer membrane protein
MIKKSRLYLPPGLLVVLLVILIFIVPNRSFAQALITIKGTIIDEQTKESLPGAVVKLKSGNKVSSTNADGLYSIQVKANDVLIFSYIGYESRSILVGKEKIINVALKPNVNALNEIVVIGYGSVGKEDLTGSVGQVKMADLEKAPVQSFEQALAGRIAGVQVSSRDGQPGDGMNIVIRGANSLTQSNSPLYVIDGFPIEDPDNAALNPDDIETLNILKDASATAIYGARGANGVIVIETKKGKVGSPVVTLNNSVGFQQPQKFVDVMDPYEFVKYQSQLNPTLARVRYFNDGRTLESYKEIEGVNWQEELFRKSSTRIHNLSVRGGTTQTKYSISGSIFDQEGIIINTGYDRYQGRVSLDQTISNKIKAGITVNYSKIQAKGQQISAGNTSSFTSYLLSRGWGYRPVTGNPNFNLLEEESDPDNLNMFDVRLNPVITSNNEHAVTTSGDLLAQAYIDYAITKNLTLKVTGSTSSRQERRDLYFSSNTIQGNLLNLFNTRGVNGSVRYMEKNVWSNENTLTYNKVFNKNHKLNALAGFSMQEINSDEFGYASQQLPNEVLGMSGLDQGIPYSGMALISDNTLASAFGRINYSYKSRYMITGTFRADGSSKFAQGNKWGYFPSAALGWNMHNESFMKNIPVISESKFRLSYGITGNNRVGDFSYYPSLGVPVINSYSFNNGTPTQGVIPDDLGNSALKWESTEQMDIGYDLGLFKNRLSLTIDLYRKTTKDLLLNANLPTTTGYTSAYKNIGIIKNEGLELSLNTVNIKTKSFSWSSSFNISFNKNKIVELTNGQDKLFSIASFESQYNGTPLYVTEVGQPAGMFYGYIFDGIFQYEDFDSPTPGSYVLKKNVPTNASDRSTLVSPGDIKYRDINEDGVINSYDLAVIGRGQPIHTGGFTNNFSYKGFDLNIFFQWSYGNDIYNANRIMFEGNGNSRTDLNQFASYVDRWSPENPSTTKFRAGGSGPLGYHSSRVIEDGSYLRLKTFSLGYNVLPRLIKSLYLTRLNLNVSAQNLITWTNYSGMDPEVSVRNSVLTPGFDFSAYPIARTLVFGLKATF